MKEVHIQDSYYAGQILSVSAWSYNLIAYCNVMSVATHMLALLPNDAVCRHSVQFIVHRNHTSIQYIDANECTRLLYTLT